MFSENCSHIPCMSNCRSMMEYAEKKDFFQKHALRIFASWTNTHSIAPRGATWKFSGPRLLMPIGFSRKMHLGRKTHMHRRHPSDVPDSPCSSKEPLKRACLQPFGGASTVVLRAESRSIDRLNAWVCANGHTCMLPRRRIVESFSNSICILLRIELSH